MQSKAKLRVAVLFGGRSAEHEISLLSARFVVESLDPERYETILIGIDKAGRWLIQDQAALLSGTRDPRLVKLNQASVGALLPPHPERDQTHIVRLEGGSSIGIDVVFPVMHGPLAEDGTIQGLLELAGVPYVGAGVLGSAVGMDKDVMKRLLLQAGLPVLPYRCVRRRAWDSARQPVLADIAALNYPLFVKPANLGSSVGVRRVLAASELEAAIDYAFEFDDKLVIEAGLDHPREIECAVLGGKEPSASIPGEIVIDHPDGFYSYAAKYIDETGATTKVPAALSAEQTALVQELALKTFDVLECEGLARVDLFLSSGGDLYVNEINTLPGFTAISMFPKLWAASGVDPKTLMARLIEAAIERGNRKNQRRSSV